MLASHYSIRSNETVAFGDDQNDVKMFQTCGTGVTMENAIQKLKIMWILFVHPMKTMVLQNGLKETSS